jgi:hypothetical protein
MIEQITRSIPHVSFDHSHTKRKLKKEEKKRKTEDRIRIGTNM